MKFVLVLLVSEAAGWAAADSRAVAEAHAGLALAREGKYELSIPRYRAAIALDPHLPGINLNLGLAHFKLNQLPDAASAFERAAKADPASFQARMPLIKTPGRQEK
jgi:tetratricopeptide (TPR) repeat protein